MENEKVMLLSYIPLLYGSGSVITDPNPNEIAAMLEQAEESCNGAAAACLWVQENGTNNASPVFVFENASEIADHLMWWCQEKPAKWFKVYIESDDDKYSIIVAPDIHQSIARFSYMQSEVDGSKYNKENITLITLPIRFRSQNVDTFNKIKDIIPKDKIQIGLINTADLEAGDVFSKIKFIGHINIGDPKDMPNMNG